MVQVDSEAIDEIDYDAIGSTLFVGFVDGDWYSYFGVSSSLYESFLAADSHGRFFHDRVRDRHPYRRGR